MKINKILLLICFSSSLFSESGYDHGTSAGKGNFDFAITINPFKKIDYGQSYVIFGYGINDKLDFHGYLSHQESNNYNHYLGLMYQFVDKEYFDLSTAFGIRSYNYQNNKHYFFPQILYSFHLTDKTSIRGSFVNLRDYSLINNSLGIAKDIALKHLIFKNKSLIIMLSLGSFSPVLWQPISGNWHPTYSFDISIKR